MRRALLHSTALRTIVAAVLALAAQAGAAPRAVHGEFSWEEPKGWVARDAWVSAVPSYALLEGDVSLWVTLYRAGNPLFTDAKAYRAHRSRAQRKPRRSEDAATASGKAEVWEQDYDESVSAVHGKGKPAAAMRERFALIERGGKFWVLSVKAPRAKFDAAEKAFAAALASFKTL